MNYHILSSSLDILDLHSLAKKESIEYVTHGLKNLFGQDIKRIFSSKVYSKMNQTKAKNHGHI